MDDINLNSSQESLLSQETLNYLYNVCQDENGQLLAELNDLSEIVPEQSPGFEEWAQVPSARSSLPGTADYPGEVGFNVTFGPQDLTAEKKKINWVYSEEKNKLYVKKDAPCPVNFSTSFPMCPGMFVRAMPLYTSPEFNSRVVTRCLSHAIPELNQKKVDAMHIVRSESSAATYHENTEDGRLSVVIPFENPPAGQSFSTYIYKFPCWNSCAGGPNRRALTLVFTLEQNNRILGRRSIELKVCACPGRDSGTLEKDVTNNSVKRKMEPEPKPQQKTKKMLPQLPISRLSSKKDSKDERKKFTIATTDFECYKFLGQMKRFYHFNEKMRGIPTELSVFFNLLRSSGSEDERSHDEYETMKQ